MSRRNNIRRRFLGSYLAVASAPLILLAIVTGWIGASSLQIAAQDTQHEIGLRVGAAVIRYLERVVNSVEVFDRHFDLIDQSRKEAESSLSDLLLDNQALQSALIMSNDGTKTIEAYIDRDHLFRESNDFISIAQELIDVVSERRMPVFGSLRHHDANGRPRFVFSYPLINLRTGFVDKALTVVVRGEELWRILREISISEHRDVYVVDPSGLLIAHRDSTLVLQRRSLASPDKEGIRRGLSGDLVIAASHRANVNDAIFIVVAEHQLLAALAPALRLILVVCAFFGGGIILALWLSNLNYKKIVEPIEIISRVAQAISKGDLTLRSNLKGQDEINQLGRVFDEMIDNFQRLMSDERDARRELALALGELNKLNLSLEAKVKERTVQLEAALVTEKQTNAMQRRFVSMVSHEFRTPLAIIDGAVRQIQRATDSGNLGRVPKNTQRIKSSIERLIGLITNVLETSKFQAGQIEYHPASMSVGEIVAEVVELQSLAAPHMKIEIMSESTGDITGDPKLVFQIVTNLVSNAVKYSGDSNLVEVTLREQANAVELAVRDFGVGVPADEIPKLFTTFFRASTADGVAGTGLGLNLCKAFAEMHGGTLQFASSVGQGSTATLWLPKMAKALPSAA